MITKTRRNYGDQLRLSSLNFISAYLNRVWTLMNYWSLFVSTWDICQDRDRSILWLTFFENCFPYVPSNTILQKLGKVVRLVNFSKKTKKVSQPFSLCGTLSVETNVHGTLVLTNKIWWNPVFFYVAFFGYRGTGMDLTAYLYPEIKLFTVKTL